MKFLASSSGVAPVAYNATMLLWSGSISTAMIGFKKTIPVNKLLRTGDVLDYGQAYVGFKTNLEIAQQGATFIGFRCLAPPCAIIPYR